MTAIAQSSAVLQSLAPQFLVRDLDAALRFYRDILGFETLFVFEGFYAAVGRDGISIHLKHTDDPDPARAFKKEREHLDVYLQVKEIDALYSEYKGRGAPFLKPLAATDWSTREFTVVDLDGYILYFGEPQSAKQGPD